jgi:hypothetical protein
MNVMLDLETWGTRPGCAIRSIGAIAFDFAVENGRPIEFYCNIDALSCKEAGLVLEKGTVDWWNQQSKTAIDAWSVNQKPLLIVVREFKAWWASVSGEKVWSQGANFDSVLWEFACRAVGLEAPWRFFNVRDTRTLYDAAGLDSRTLANAGIAHHALDDCRHQIMLCRMAWRAIKSRTKAPA